MIKYIDKILIACMAFSAVVATYLAFTADTNLLYVG